MYRSAAERPHWKLYCDILGIVVSSEFDSFFSGENGEEDSNLLKPSGIGRLFFVGSCVRHHRRAVEVQFITGLQYRCGARILFSSHDRKLHPHVVYHRCPLLCKPFSPNMYFTYGAMYRMASLSLLLASFRI